ncbi:MAG: L,D-transpeptidase family protein [Ectothiorhodospiraceae bacterium]|nr:L,D-transpeptidase family protein [Ectothiorhodospiraceae bacterium]
MKRRRFLAQTMTAAAACLLLPSLLRADDAELEGDELADGAAAPEALKRSVFPLPPKDVDVIGEIQIIQARPEDTLLDIGRRYGVGFEAMRMANPGVDIWMPGEDTEIVIPTRFILPPGPRRGLVVNLPEMRIYFYPEPKPGQPRVVETYAVSIGRMDWNTPIGTHRVTNRIENPAWFPPESVRARHAAEGRTLPRRIDPGPDNPLGQYAIGLNVPGYFIHGTNRPYGIGMRATHGCIRMYPEDIESLVYRLPIGTEVRIINQPYKAGWFAGELLVQAYPVLDEHQGQEVGTYASAVRAVAARLEDRPGRIDYERLKAVVNTADGLPRSVSRQSEIRPEMVSSG